MRRHPETGAIRKRIGQGTRQRDPMRTDTNPASRDRSVRTY
ncbi:hypothetical protein CLV77_0639 [Brevirhabdus pacifica]|nr:hypothetical protein CLV77_0639 [Brevirhabdus pacifica]